MNYSLTNVSTAAECDDLLAFANEEKEALVHRKNNLLYSVNSGTDESLYVNAKTVALQAELGALTSVVNTLGPKEKKEMENRMGRIQAQLTSLGVRKNEVGGLVILRRELQLGQLEAEIAATDDFIAQVSARKASL